MRVKILLLLFVFSFLFKTDNSFDQDLGRHLKLGEIIWQTRSVPDINLFSYTNPDFPFINSHWLFEIFIYLAQQAVGLSVVLILKLVIILLAVWLTLVIIPKNQLLLLPVGFIFLHVLRERPELRPEIFSFLFTSLTLYILNRFEKDSSRLIIVLPIIQLIWVNTHIYFPVGLILQAIFLLHLAYLHLRSHLTSGKLKLLAIIFLASIFVSLINPNGLAGFFYPLNVSKNYGYTIVENQTMFFLEKINFQNPNFLFVKLSIGLVILLLAISLIRKRVEIKNVLLAGFGVTLALMNVRSFPYLVFLSLPAILQNFDIIKYRGMVKMLIVIFSGILLLESYFYLKGDYYLYKGSTDKVGLSFTESGKKGLDFVIQNDLPGPIYNNFDIGGYLIYKGYPKYRPFIDNRPESYPKDFFLSVYIPTQANYPEFKKLEKTYGFRTVIFSHTDQTPWGKAFLSSITKDKNWKTVYIDDFMIVLVLSDVQLKPIDLPNLDHVSYSFENHVSYLRLAVFLAQTGYLQPAREFTQKALSIFPESPIGNAMFGIKTEKSIFW